MTSLPEIETRRAPGLSRRALEMPASPIRKLAPLAEAAKARGTHVLHLNIGQPDIETPACMRDRLKEIDTRVLEYSPSTGTPEFLRSLASYYERRLGIRLELNQILATTGGSEAILFAFLACANEGDDVMVVEPFYANYKAFATMAGLNLVPVTSRGRDGFHVPPRAVFERALTPRTRILILCNPGNPTGTVYTREELEMIADFCRENDLFLISDEVYREFVYGSKRALSALELHDADEFTIVVDSLSKRYSACGIRLGALVTRNAEVYEACLRMAQGRLSPPGLAQFIAVGVESLGDDYTFDMVEEYRRRRDVLYQGLTSIPGVELSEPEGAFYCMPRLPVQNAEDFAIWLLSDFSHEGATVMVAPASGFYATPGLGKSEVRIAYVLNEHDLRRAVEVLRVALTRYPLGLLPS
ncbi:MAG TPA: pyridoxal phosphate-dependent aminotransferase [Thermoanaerobaculia bacterium]|jgi:aspartate aminotransferase|nr:pyridoxal phosphate-dependent aminotransferase [Thermoanaerobaculia bacterium]